MSYSFGMFVAAEGPLEVFDISYFGVWVILWYPLSTSLLYLLPFFIIVVGP